MDMDEKQFFIFGLPIQTEYCVVRFLTYFEYLQNIADLSAMNQNILHIYYQYKDFYEKSPIPEEDKPLLKEALEELKKETLYNIVMGREDFSNAYFKIFRLVIDDSEFVEKIMSNENLFMNYRKLVLEMNMLTEADVSPNEEIQKGIERSRRVKQADSKDKQTFGDIVSSIVVGAGIMPQDIAKMTVLQVYSIFYRISQFQSYTATTLFATVAEKVQIESWNKHIDLWEKESHTIDRTEFEKQYGSIF